MTSADFLDAALRNPIHTALFDELDRRALPDAWIVAGSLTQTAWNALTGCAVDYGINDYDVFYFDPDPSWEAEDRVIASLRDLSDRLGARIELRNQARVHLWYPQKHGTPYPALTRATDGIDRFLTRCTQVGIRRNAQGDIDVYAPAGLDDVAAMIVRPNLTPNFSAEAYRAKAARWLTLWPELEVLPPGNLV
ncbi:nucleotidyltransferase family protein [Rhodopseudomonas sp. P2A-2r]|uniref:nucleotidyltransferase family protein n=1 Tax=unclassified Rhodopseudomonas TaxID=2638247 RepID=UPI002233F666|nr:nucleotidyltransferase family protein [Rhodopseudomonas sp. P2A-2r]UZE49182.1 nucleotidyltransferase family protein [Rhodopseudomonas sp. P2A-2r]